MVLALPSLTQVWSEWLCDPSRLLTILSRYRYQLVMTFASDKGLAPRNDRARETLTESVNAALGLQRSAVEVWNSERMLTSFGWPQHVGVQISSGWTHQTVAVISSWTASETRSTEVMVTWSAATASTTTTSLLSTSPR